MNNEILTPEKIFQNFVERLVQEIEIKNKNNIEGDRWEERDSNWTELVKKSFLTLVKENNFEVYSSLQGKGECLLDLTWESRNEKSGGLTLGLESEWGNAEAIEEDFYKLMYTKCKLKVLVYSSTSDKQAKELINRLKESLCWFDRHNLKEMYLFIDVTNYKVNNKIIGYEFNVPNNGKLDKENINFCKIKEFNWDEKRKNYLL